MVGPNPILLMHLEEEEIRRQKDDHMNTQREDSYQKTKERGLKRNKLFRNLDLRLLTSIIVRQ